MSYTGLAESATEMLVGAATAVVVSGLDAQETSAMARSDGARIRSGVMSRI